MPTQRLLPGEPLWALLTTKEARETVASLEPGERAALKALDARLHPFGVWRPLLRRPFLLSSFAVFIGLSWWLGPVRGAAVFFGLTGGGLLVMAARDLVRGPRLPLAGVAREVALCLARSRHAKREGYGVEELLGDGWEDNGGEVGQ